MQSVCVSARGQQLNAYARGQHLRFCVKDFVTMSLGASEGTQGGSKQTGWVSRQELPHCSFSPTPWSGTPNSGAKVI